MGLLTNRPTGTQQKMPDRVGGTHDKQGFEGTDYQDVIEQGRNAVQESESTFRS
jgi:hypothetical protein